MKVYRSLAIAIACCWSSPAWASWGIDPAGIDEGRAGSDGAAAAIAPSPIQDAQGDALDAFDAGPPLLDIDALDLRFDAAALHFSMTFFTEIAPPSSGEPNGLVGVIELDLDQNSSTGRPPVQNMYSPPFASLGIGVDALIVMFEEAASPGMFAVFDDQMASLGTVPAMYTPTSVSGSVPLAMLGDDGIADFVAIIGTVPQPTDAMDAVGTSVPVPEPGAFALAALSAGGLVAPRHFRNRRGRSLRAC
jgi:hypothetical protein